MNGVFHCWSLFVGCRYPHSACARTHISDRYVPLLRDGGDRGVLCDDNALLHYVINVVDSVPTVACS